jgi:hypothetical protein
MKNYKKIVSNHVKNNVGWVFLKNTVSTHVWDKIWDIVRIRVYDVIWNNVGNTIEDDIWAIIDNHKLFQYNHLQQYKDNL